MCPQGPFQTLSHTLARTVLLKTTSNGPQVKSRRDKATTNALSAAEAEDLSCICSDDLNSTMLHSTKEGTPPSSPCQSDLEENSYLPPHLVISWTP